MTALLNAAAQAFALVCHADGRLRPEEAERFFLFVRTHPAFSGVESEDLTLAWNTATRHVSGAADFAASLPQITAGADTDDARLTLLRAAQAAIVADGASHPQEDAAIEAVAAALGFDEEA